MTSTRGLAAAVVVMAVLPLAVALAAQHFAGLTPCALCLIARWPYRIAIAAGVLACLLPRRLAVGMLWLAFGCFLADFAVASVHIGVESGFWKSPLPECTAPSLAGLAGAALLAAMPLRPVTPCDAPVYLIPGFHLSMAAMNWLYALLAGIALAAGLTRRSPP